MKELDENDWLNSDVEIKVTYGKKRKRITNDTSKKEST